MASGLSFEAGVGSFGKTINIQKPKYDLYAYREVFVVGSAIRRDLKRSGKVQHLICHPKKRLCFFITADRVIVQTGMQTFVLEPVEVPGDLWRRRLTKVRQDIIKRRIRCIDDLFHECNGAINIIPTTLERHV